MEGSMNIYQLQKQNPDMVWDIVPHNKIIQETFELLFAYLPDECIDLVLTDPPYWTLDKWREMGTTARLGGHYDPDKRDEEKWFPTIKEWQLETLLHETYRVLKDNRFAYIMCDWQVLGKIYEITENQCWNYWKPLVWNKVNKGMGYHWRAQYEFIVLFQKGKTKLRMLDKPDILTFPRVTNRYPTEKPLRLFELLIKNSTDEGQLVLDPFVGSGTTAEACLILNRDYLCGDIDPKAINWANNRIKSISLELFSE